MHELSSGDVKNYLFTPDLALANQRKDSMQIQLDEPMGLLRLYMGDSPSYLNNLPETAEEFHSPHE